MSSSNSLLYDKGGLSVNTPEILWQGGGTDHGKTDPVFSIDFHPTLPLLISSGIDASVPPRGSIRLWKIDIKDRSIQPIFHLELDDHQSCVNIARFSRCGRMIATASDKQLIVYRIPSQINSSPMSSPSANSSSGPSWFDIDDPKLLEKTWLRPSLSEITHLDWSPCSKYVLIGAVEGKGEVIRVLTKDSIILQGHTSHLQGVAWDPLNKWVATQSSDRSCRLHNIRFKDNKMVQLNPRGNVTLKMHTGMEKMLDKILNSSDPTTEKDSTQNSEVKENEDFVAESTPPTKIIGLNLYADSNVPSFFRRLTFTPDGSLLITPCGIHRDFNAVLNKLQTTQNTTGSHIRNFTNNNTLHSFCTHIFSRESPSSPCLSLIGLDNPSVGVRCCPLLFKLVNTSGSSNNNISHYYPVDTLTTTITIGPNGVVSNEGATEAETKSSSESEVNSNTNSDNNQPLSLFHSHYRILFAVFTITSVYIYDTQHPHPLLKINGIHFASINDATWSGDGKILSVCSSDGYVTFIHFDQFKEGSTNNNYLITEPLEFKDIPMVVKENNPSLYNYYYYKKNILNRDDNNDEEYFEYLKKKEEYEELNINRVKTNRKTPAKDISGSSVKLFNDESEQIDEDNKKEEIKKEENKDESKSLPLKRPFSETSSEPVASTTEIKVLIPRPKNRITPTVTQPLTDNSQNSEK